MYSVAVEWIILQISIKFISCMVLFNSEVCLFIFAWMYYLWSEKDLKVNHYYCFGGLSEHLYLERFLSEILCHDLVHVSLQFLSPPD
jgi:hypothetical protein